MESVTMTRNQLYELIWSKPATALAKEFGLSDNGLRKVCKKFNIPLPYAGYWAKIKYGKPARKVKLPVSFEGKDEITFSGSTETQDENQKKFSEKTNLIKDIESKYKKLLEVPSRLTNPDILIINTKDALISNKMKESNNELAGYRTKYLNVIVTPENIPRALRFMDALIKLLKARGHVIRIDHDETRVVVFDEALVIRLQEKYRIEDVIEGKYNWKTRHYYPTGIFMLRCWKDFHWHQKVWMDGKALIETQLAKIVAGVELLAIKEKKERLENEELQRIQKEKRRIEQEKHDREALDGANFLKLLEQSKKWKQTQILNEFIAEIENKAGLSGILTDELIEWLKWAKEKAEKYNPMNEL